jgi:hypothetical protein
MTPEEAIKMLKYNSNVIHKTINGETDINEVEALDMAISALEKQIPLKHLPYEMGADGTVFFPCGNCGEDVKDFDFCPWCGQKVG